MSSWSVSTVSVQLAPAIHSLMSVERSLLVISKTRRRLVEAVPFQSQPTHFLFSKFLFVFFSFWLPTQFETFLIILRVSFVLLVVNIPSTNSFTLQEIINHKSLHSCHLHWIIFRQWLTSSLHLIHCNTYAACYHPNMALSGRTSRHCFELFGLCVKTPPSTR